jgi:hypothetical protein
MKIYPQLKFKNVLMIGAFLGVTAFFQSCKVDNDVPTPDVAALTIVNASPNSNGLDFYIDNQKVNGTAFNFPLRIPYQRVYAGKRSAKVTTSANPATLVSGDLTLLTNEYHSLFIAGKVESPEFVLIKDDLNYPPVGKTKIRFGNLSPDASALSLEIVGDTTQFANQPYKSFTAFKAVKPGKVSLRLKDNTTNATLVTMDNVEFASDKVYTVWVKGLGTTTVEAQKRGLHIINHDI